MINRRNIFWAAIIVIVGLPLWMWLAWILTPKKILDIVIVDKTVLSPKGQEHVSLNWVLKNQRYTKHNYEFYSVANDYFGFFPRAEQAYELMGLEKKSLTQLDSMARHSDMAYFTDTYGIYYNEWYRHKNQTEHSECIYGGLSAQDLYLIKKLKQQQKLVIAEFNTIASPTDNDKRKDFEQTFGLEWSGWVGRYIQDLDTNRNKELPKWLKRDYVNQHNNRWPFSKSGIAFVHESGKVEILENETHLTNEYPIINTNRESQLRFSLPKKIKYAFWFDIMRTKHTNNVVSVYSIHTNSKGDSIMWANNILHNFPAVIEHYDDAYKFYYFSGDFADNPITHGTSVFRGIRFFSGLFYNPDDKAERNSFFWEFYTPLMFTILDNYNKYLDGKRQ